MTYKTYVCPRLDDSMIHILSQGAYPKPLPRFQRGGFLSFHLQKHAFDAPK